MIIIDRADKTPWSGPLANSVNPRSWAIKVLIGFGYVGCFGLLSALTSIIAAVIGTISVGLLGAGPIGVAFVFLPFVTFFSFPIGFVLSAPITFVLFPIGALLLRRVPVLLPTGLGLIGLVAGGLMTWLWTQTFSPSRLLSDPDLISALILSGSFSGLVAGVFYGHVTKESEL